jgi:hypothetical protein
LALVCAAIQLSANLALPAREKFSSINFIFYGAVGPLWVRYESAKDWWLQKKMRGKAFQGTTPQLFLAILYISSKNVISQ